MGMITLPTRFESGPCCMKSLPESNPCLSERAIISMLASSSKKHLAPRMRSNGKRGQIMERVITFIGARGFIAVSLLLIVNTASVAQGQSKNSKRVADATSQAQKAARVFTEIMNIPDQAIPQKLLDKAE